MRDIAAILNQVVGENKSILIIAEDFDGEVLETLKVNKLDGRLKVCAIKTPSFGEYRHEVLNDIAVLTGGTNISYDSGMELTDVTISMLGKCDKINVTKNYTTIINGHGEKEAINGHVLKLKEELRNEQKSSDSSDFLIKFLKERIAKLVGGIAVIRVGGTTEIELNERKDRIDDAVSATKAAIEEGVVLGGGLTYYNASKFIHKLSSKDKDINLGIRIVEEALKEPFNIIVRNAGYNPKNLYKGLTDIVGFDANEEKFVNMYQSGIIDPAKASRLALENSSSIACLFLSTECVIVPQVVNQLVI
jgi:chaperonin GroEL